MKQINLLPPQIAIQQARYRRIPAFGVAVVLAVLLVLTPWYIFGSLNDSVAESVQKQEAVLGLGVPDVASAQASLAASQTTRLNSKIEMINALSKREVSWNVAFGLVGKLVPKDIVLSSYSIDVLSSVVSFRLMGQAPSTVSFASFVQSLKQNTDLKTVSVETYTLTPATGTVLFSVSVTVSSSLVGYTGAN